MYMKSIIKYIFMVFVFGILVMPNAKAQQTLSLQDAVNLALEKNPEIAASNLELEKSKQQKVISRSLFLPFDKRRRAGESLF